MKKPCVRCPSGYVRKRVTDGEFVVVCRIIGDKMLRKENTYPHFEIVPSNCQDDEYVKCQVWRDEKDEGWRNKIGAGKRYSSIEQMERVLV